MRSICFPVIRRILVPAVMGCLFLAGTPKIFASADDHTDEALAVARAWVGQIDAGQYEASYQEAGDALREKVDETKWVAVLQTLRTPWGAVVNRTQTSHLYKPNGYAGSEGEFMLITYDTSFQKMDSGIELVVLKWEDGKWRGAGYTGGPKPTPDDQAQQPQPPQTEMTTKTVHNPVQQ